MNHKTIEILKAAADIIAIQSFEKDGGDLDKWKGVYRTLQPEYFDVDAETWLRVFDWQRHNSARLILAAIDQVTGVAGVTEADLLSIRQQIGSPEPGENWMWLGPGYELYRDLMCFRVIEKLIELRRAQKPGDK